jgi:alpha-mannosidase
METMLKAIIPSTHVDIAWKKDTDEMSEIFEKVLICLVDILEKNEDITYVLEQACLFYNLGGQRSDLIAKLRSHVARGRVEVVGGMASSVETNIINGECIIKNFLLGKSWFTKNLNAQIKVAWLIDTFGINAQMPQMIRQFGLSYLFANRLGGDKIHTRFVAKGIDGSRLPVLGKDVNAPRVLDEGLYWDFLFNWNRADELFAQGEQSRWIDGFKLLMPYTENEFTPSIRLIHNAKIFAAKNWKYIIPSDLIEYIEKDIPRWAEYDGDLNPEFTGTFSNRAVLRIQNRKIENRLLGLEEFLCLCGGESCLRHRETLERLWWDMAFIQSHDVITGSLPSKVFNHAIETMEHCDKAITAVFEETLDSIITGTGKDDYLVIWKGPVSEKMPYISIMLPSHFPEPAEIEYEGSPLAFYKEDNILKIFCTGMTYGLYSFRIQQGGANKIAPRQDIQNKCTIANSKILINLSKKEGICGLDFSDGMTRIIKSISLVIQEDRGNFQIEEPVGSEIESILNIQNLEVLDASPIKKAVLMGSFPAPPWDKENPPSSWIMECILNGDVPFVELKVHLCWKGEKSRIRLKIASAVDSAFHYDEIPFGVVKRGSYRDRATCRGEWPVHRFSCIEGHGYGLALINFGTCGIEYSGSDIRTTLLRAPYTEYAGMIPDNTSSQHGDHCFSFLIVPYKGTWKENNIPLLSAAANDQVFAFMAKMPAAKGPLIKCCSENVIISSVTMVSGDSQDILVRFYETTGSETLVNFWRRDCKSCWESDIAGNKNISLPLQNGVCEFKISPFEIKTLRFA